MCSKAYTDYKRLNQVPNLIFSVDIEVSTPSFISHYSLIKSLLVNMLMMELRGGLLDHKEKKFGLIFIFIFCLTKVFYQPDGHLHLF